MPTARDTGQVAVTTELGLTAVIAFVMISGLLADRAVISVATGGRGALGVLTFAAPAAAMFTVARLGISRTLGFLRSPVFVLAVMPYLLLTLLFPVLGIMFNGYPERTLIALSEATTAFAFLVLGAALSRSELRRWRPWIVLAIVLQLLYALGQVAYVGRGPGWELFGPFHDWDLSLQTLYGDFVQARATGLYFNPNELGLWAGVAAILAWTILTPRVRIVGVTLAVLTLLVSQSRGASVALLAVVAVGVVLAVLRRRTSVSGTARAALSIGLAAAVAVAVVAVLEPSQGLVDRFGALFAVWAQGPRADANLAGRLEYWASVIDLNAVYPWGTWGSPELLLGSAVDSSWFRAFAQGSVPYVAALVLLLVAPFAVRDTRFGEALVLMTVLLAVAGLTQTPLSYPIIFVFWALLGAGLQASIDQRDSKAAEVAATGGGRPSGRRGGAYRDGFGGRPGDARPTVGSPAMGPRSVD